MFVPLSSTTPPPFDSKTWQAAVRFVIAPSVVPFGGELVSVEVAPTSNLNNLPTTFGSKLMVSPTKAELVVATAGPAESSACPPSYVINLKESARETPDKPLICCFRLFRSSGERIQARTPSLLVQHKEEG